MTFQKTLIFTVISSCFLMGGSFATQSSTNNSDYTITLLKDCIVVAKHAMNAEQITTYQTLQVEENKMRALEQPIQAIEQQLHDYTKQIKELTALAIKDQNGSLDVDKRYLKQQENVVAKLELFMDEHQHEFAALEQQGRLIGTKADDFAETIKGKFDDVDYNQIRIEYPGKSYVNDYCDGEISNI